MTKHTVETQDIASEFNDIVFLLVLFAIPALFTLLVFEPVREYSGLIVFAVFCSAILPSIIERIFR